MRNFLIPLFSLLFLTACNSYKDKVISSETIDAAWEKTEKNTALSETEKVFFASLYHMNKGRKAYVVWLTTFSPESKPEDFDRIVVSETDFDHISKQIFSVLSDNGKTYRTVSAEIREATALADLYADKLILTYRSIDSVCVEINKQNTMSFKYKTPEQLFGYCPFLPDNHPLYQEAESIRNDRDTEIELKFPILSKVRKLEGDLFLGY